ncbi:hypothetical protein [Rudaeicoccus suwonensis]|uniref:Nucleotidyltransferase-like protein n=1 Tax=Rudaeicoccus suwonensis TaxID=657409 RepID=A0A561EC25_9MICO|nr:hypothetical protein [Rudaeicoccus suwonensis]TWE13165.1 hypothetical protein BKA23_1994 [Rudaeicoccus suwonensis]
MSAQSELIESLSRQLEDDERFRGFWLTGSFGTGQDDEWSDVDTLAIVTPESYDAVIAGFPEFADELVHPVLCRRLGQAPIFNLVLPGWLRWDIAFSTPDRTPSLELGSVRTLFDKDRVPLTAPVPRKIDNQRTYDVTVEFLRILGLLPVVVGRDDAVTAISGAGLLRQHLITLLRLRHEPGAPSGALHLTRVLPESDIDALLRLPTASTMAEAIAAHAAIADRFRIAAREMLGSSYPADLDRACLQHLRDSLGTRWP